MEVKEKRSYEQDRALDKAQMETIAKNAKGNTMKHDFAIRLNGLLQKRGMTQEALANKTKNVARKYKSKASISTASMSDYINGKALPNSEKAILMADALGVTCDELLRGIKSENIGVNEKTGLSDEAIDVIGNQLNCETQKILSHIIENERFTELLLTIDEVIFQKNLYDRYIYEKAKEIEAMDAITASKIILKMSGTNETAVAFRNNTSHTDLREVETKEYLYVLHYKLNRLFESLIDDVTYFKDFDANIFSRIIQLIGSQDDDASYETKIRMLKKAQSGHFNDVLQPAVVKRFRIDKQVKEGTQNGNS